jgi:inner membrane protein
MASVGHVAVGLAAGRLFAKDAPPKSRALVMLGFSALSLLPDLDAIGFKLGVAYADPWGHRGATHSFVFAAAVGLLVGAALKLSGRAGFVRVAACSAAVVASHPLLDALTTGGLGVGLLWPLSSQRFFAPVRVIPVSPIGFGLLSMRGLYVFCAELVLFSPLFLYALWPRRQTPGRAL